MRHDIRQPRDQRRESNRDGHAFLQEICPSDLLKAHPASQVFLAFTVLLTGSVAVLWMLGRTEWLTALIVSGVLWLKFVLGVWGAVRFRHWNFEPDDPCDAVVHANSTAVDSTETESNKSSIDNEMNRLRASILPSIHLLDGRLTLMTRLG